MPDPLLSPSRQIFPLADRAFQRSPTERPRRLALWEIDGSLQCSIIGTCLSDQDLLTAVRKHRLQIDRNAHSYDLHSYCVRAANEDCALARSLNKLLEHRFAGAVRLMGRAKTDEEVRLVWDQLRNGGQIAAGYWAVMSHTHVPASLKTRVFGEVHMDLFALQYWKPSTWSKPDLKVLLPSLIVGTGLGYVALRILDARAVAIAMALITLAFTLLWFHGGRRG